MRVISSRLETKLVTYQPDERADFTKKSAIRTLPYVFHSVKLVIEKTADYNYGQCICNKIVLQWVTLWLHAITALHYNMD